MEYGQRIAKANVLVEFPFFAGRERPSIRLGAQLLHSCAVRGTELNAEKEPGDVRRKVCLLIPRKELDDLKFAVDHPHIITCLPYQ